jgi:ACS family glucarate transporter-like MFS transporter
MPVPTRARYRVVALATTLAMITYLDRACIASLAPGIMRDLGLTTVQMGYVFTVFQLAYALFEIPTAWWADRKGTRSVLSRIVIWWSFLTAATGAAFSYPALLVIRFLFGAGEAGAWPCVARTFSRWIPRRERGTVQGIFFAGAHLVGGLTPALVLWLLQYLSWRQIFVAFGSLGFVWAAVWLAWFRDDPADHRSVNAEELQTILADRTPEADHPAGLGYWRSLATSRNMMALCLMYVPNCMIFYFCITWLPTYLREHHGFEAASLGLFAGLPLIVSMPGDLLGGVVTDRLSSRFGMRIGRCGLGAVSYVIAGVALLAAARSSSPVAAAVLIAVAGLIKLPAVAALGFLPMLRPTWRQRFSAAALVGSTAVATGVVLTAASGLGYGWLHTLDAGTAKLSIFSPTTGAGVALGHLLDALGLVERPDTVVRLVFMAALAVSGLIAIVLLLRAHHTGPMRALGLTLVAVVALAPVVQPWYLLWGLVLLAAVGGERVTLALGALSLALCLSLFPSGISLFSPPMYGVPVLFAVAIATIEVRRAAHVVLDEPVHER